MNAPNVRGISVYWPKNETMAYQNNTTQLNIYLTFNGNCREAMEFYHSCLGGNLEIMDFAGAPEGSVSAEEKHLVMHARIDNGALVLMASDTTAAHPKVTTGSSMTISMNCSSEEEINDVFGKLSAGGNVTMPLEDTFWGARFGMLVDKFGMPWMFNYDRPQN